MTGGGIHGLSPRKCGLLVCQPGNTVYQLMEASFV